MSDIQGSGEGQKPSAKLLFEMWHPFLIGILAFWATYYFRDLLTVKFNTGGWKLDNLYAAVFDWSAIQTGFLFAVYGFVVGKADGFIAEIKRTKAMDRFINYTKRANFIGFSLTLVSIIFIVVSPSINSGASWVYFIITAWFSLFVWAFLAFLRVAYIFGIIARVRDREVIKG